MSKTIKRFFIAIIIILFLFISFCLGILFEKWKITREKNQKFAAQMKEEVDFNNRDYSWVEDNSLIAHSFGIAGEKRMDHSNSLEAFENSYKNGFKVYEVDLSLTEDYIPVCWHHEDEWVQYDNNGDKLSFTYQNFKNSKVFNQYTPLDYKDLINLLVKYQDVYIIIDGKYTNEIEYYAEYSQIVDYAKEIDQSILDRIVPELYNEEMINKVIDIYPFKSVIYSLYLQAGWERGQVVDFCKKKDIRLITVGVEVASEDLIEFFNKNEIMIALFTINTMEDAEYYFNQNVSLLYTDELVPSECYDMKK